ncbi:MAG: DEAD/DEAH box helicase, partial [Acidobacteriota bacterium]
MPPRFDPQALRLELSVADLLDTQLLRSLGFAHRGGYERLWLGQAIHSRYQEEALERDATYRREVTIRHELDHRGWRVGIQGRADGLRRDADGRRVVEEIKSIRRGQTLSPTVREVYARQAALYAWMLARHDLAAASDPEQVPETVAELVLIEIGGEDVERQPVEVHLDALDALVLRRLNGLLRGFRARQEQIAARRDAAEVLAFPYPERRTGQEAIIDGVGQALEERAHLLVEAPTGLGKTVAALYPALRAALRDDLKVFVLTAKTLQQDMAMAVASLLNRDGAFRSLRLRAKHKMCANDQVLCHEEYCPFAREYYAKLQRSAVVPRLLDTHETLLPEFVFDAAVEAEVCPFEVSLELGGHVQLAVCDYNYAFEPYVSLTEFADDADLSHTVLVIDEIHNLVDRGRRYYSPTLSSEAARRAAEDVALGGAPIHRQLAALCGQLEQLIYETVADLQPGRERS